MRIKSTDTVGYIFNKRGWLVSMSGDELTDKILSSKCRKSFTAGFFKRVYPKYDALGLTGCEMKDLREMQYVGDLNEHFLNVLGVQLGLDKKKIMRLPYIQAMQLYIRTTQTVSKIFTKFNELDFPLSEDERQAQYPRPSLGLFDLIRTFVKLMPMYTIKEAWGLDWELVYTELQSNRAEILTQRRLTQIKSKQK